MQSKDLRIGNLVVVSSTITKMKVEYFGKNIKGVELDLTRLVRLGFEEKGIDKVRFCQTYKLNGVKLYRSNSGNFYYKKRALLFVHELQNLYFALTGEELGLKHESKP